MRNCKGQAMRSGIAAMSPFLRGLKLLALLLPAGVFAVAAPVQARASSAGLQSGTLAFQARERSYYFHLPDPAPAAGPLPLLFALHGGGRAEGDEYAAKTGYNRIADREGFIVVYPNGVDAQWNDGRGVTFRGVPDNGKVDDVGYIGALIDLFVERYRADPARVYVEGSSNGGMMTQRIACELSGRIAAAASVISSIPANIYPECARAGVLPVLIMSSTTDPWVPWDGGAVSPLGRASGEVISVPQAITFWSSHDGCDPQPVTESLPDPDQSDGSTVLKRSYGGCDDGAQVVLYEVIGAGHSRPGMIGRVPERLLGRKNRDIDASEEIWRFVSQFTNAGKQPSAGGS